MISIFLKVVFCISGLAVILTSLLQEGKAQNGFIGVSATTDSYWSKNKKNSLEGKLDTLIKVVSSTFVASAFVLMFI